MKILERLDAITHDEMKEILDGMPSDVLCESSELAMQFFELVSPDTRPYILALTKRIRDLEEHSS